MVWHYKGAPIPLEIYHGVPKGWYANEIIVEHARLEGTFDLQGRKATEPGAPSWLPERDSWLQYRQTLYRIADGILAKDPACVELGIRFIELRYIGSYSGYIRARLSRRLKHASLSHEQKMRLHFHFLQLVEKEERTDEFREYLKLWRTLISEPIQKEALERLRKMPNGHMKAEWLEKMLSSPI